MQKESKLFSFQNCVPMEKESRTAGEAPREITQSYSGNITKFQKGVAKTIKNVGCGGCYVPKLW